MVKKMALGKGMASLIQESSGDFLTQPSSLIKETVQEEKKESSSPTVLLPIDDIHPNPNQPRKAFNEKELKELSQSIKESGILVPLIVNKTDEGHQLIAGERRFRAAQQIGLKQVPVIIKEVTEKERMIISIVENIQRSDLNCVEEALAYSSLIDEFHLTQEEIAKALGKERSTIANFLRILKLPQRVIEFIQKDQISFGHAKVLASVKEEALAINIAKEVIEKSLSVRELEDLVKRVHHGHKREEKDTMDSPFKEQMSHYRDKIEQKTGFHCHLKFTKKGSGQIILKFLDQENFNEIYEFLIER